MSWGKPFLATLIYLYERRITLVLSLFIGVPTVLLILSGLNNVQAAGFKSPPKLNSDQPRAANDATLTVGTSPDFEPFEYYSGSDIVGYDIDLMNAIGAELDLAVDYIAVQFSAVLDELAAGSYEAAISGLTITPGREEFVDFTIPYLDFDGGPIGIAVQQGNTKQRRAINEALWQLREDGTLETIRSGVDAYFNDLIVDLPDWPLVVQDMEASVAFINTQGTETEIQFPAGAFSDTVMITFTPIFTDTIPPGFSVVAQPFEVDAYHDGRFEGNPTFLTPVTIQITYSASDVLGIDEESIMLDYWNEGKGWWEDAACGPYERNPQNNRLAVPVCHLGRFAFMQEGYFIYLPSLHTK